MKQQKESLSSFVNVNTSVSLKQLELRFEAESLTEHHKWVKPFPQRGGFPAPRAECGRTPQSSGDSLFPSRHMSSWKQSFISHVKMLSLM